MVRRVARCALIFALATIATAQSPRPGPLLQLRPGLAALTDGWRTHAGDNPAWAAPGFDDSAWQPVTVAPTTPISSGSRWFRLRLHLPADQGPYAILLIAPSHSFEIWINGKRAPGFHIGSWLRMRGDSEFVVPVGGNAGDIQIALHVDLPAYLAEAYSPRFRVSVGGAPSVHAAAQAAHERRTLYFVPTVLFDFALMLAGIGALILFQFQRAHREYFWLGLFLFLLGFETATWQAVEFSLLPIWINSLLSDPLTFPVVLCQIEFSFAFINRPVNRAWRVCEAALIFSMFLAYAACFGWVAATVYWLMEAATSITVGVGLLVVLLVQYRKGNREAGLLILPSLLPAAFQAIADFYTASHALDIHLVDSVLARLLGRSPLLGINWFDLANIAYLLAIGAVLLVRFTRVSREQARTSAELEAAQRVQSLLLSRAQADHSGLRIRAEYRPAQEVGGDFFHTAQIDGATRIIIGDVSGKGMGAAMLVSVLLGAIDAIPQASPAAILARLNAILLTRQQGGFATCLCALVSADGALTLANAGHLAPYRNGEEVPIDNGLPLGIAADAAYSETTIQLAPGDHLTFLSDGVVEAQSTSRELFGFERTAAISTESAEAIAQAAQGFGQEDDITVLTLHYAPAEVHHA